MSSKRILELVNAIHHAVADPPQRKKPFGGKQVILVGEFLQLRPVPNFFGDGCFMFQSRVFHAAVGHKFERFSLDNIVQKKTGKSSEEISTARF